MRKARSSITWDFAARWRATRWPMPTRRATWRIYADFAQSLIGIARRLYADEPFGLDLEGHRLRARCHHDRSVPVGLSLGAVPLDQGGHQAAHAARSARQSSRPSSSSATARLHDVNILDQLVPEPGAFYVMDRGYIDFDRLTAFTRPAASSSSAPRPTLGPSAATRIRSTGAPASSAIRPSRSPASTRKQGLPRAAATHQCSRIPRPASAWSFSTNNFALPALTITKLYRLRWQIELFFKWIKQHLRIKAFFGTTENAVKTQIWIAVSVYVLVAIVKKRLELPASLYEILQILSLTMFERMPIDQLLSPPPPSPEDDRQIALL